MEKAPWNMDNFELMSIRSDMLGQHDVSFLFLMNIIKSIGEIMRSLRERNHLLFMVSGDVVKYCKNSNRCAEPHLLWEIVTASDEMNRRVYDVETRVGYLTRQFESFFPSQVDIDTANRFETLYSRFYRVVFEDGFAQTRRRKSDVINWGSPYMTDIIRTSRYTLLNTNDTLNKWVSGDFRKKFTDFSREISFLFVDGVYILPCPYNQVSDIMYLAREVISWDAKGYAVGELAPLHKIYHLYKLAEKIVHQ